MSALVIKFVYPAKEYEPVNLYEVRGDSQVRGFSWGWLLEHTFLKEKDMKYASAYYVATPNTEIYVFVDEEPSGLPEGAAEICKSSDIEEFLTLIEPYFILAKDK